MWFTGTKRSYMTNQDNSGTPPKDGKVGYSCPSNIALVKYWGKKPVQMPMNPSLSMTLTKARTDTRVSWQFDPRNRSPLHEFKFEGKPNIPFADRITKALRTMVEYLPFLHHTSLQIDSCNTFPHSSGIASSASAMGALAMCLVAIDQKITGSPPASILQKASFIARLGSGSASRSIYPSFVIWGTTDTWQGSSDEYAIPVNDFHGTFEGMRDSILVVESGEKRISSSAGHSLMETNPHSESRFRQAFGNMALLKPILSEGNWPGLIALMEEEALSLHAMMMTSKPGYLLMQPATLAILNKVRDYRQDTGHHVGFTMDAGANVHLLYAAQQERAVREFIEAELLEHCEDRRVLHDRMGSGPQIIIP